MCCLTCNAIVGCPDGIALFVQLQQMQKRSRGLGIATAYVSLLNQWLSICMQPFYFMTPQPCGDTILSLCIPISFVIAAQLGAVRQHPVYSIPVLS